MVISNLAINRSTTVFVLVVLIILTGVYSYLVLPRESNPEIVIPLILVTTTYEGVAPEDVESLLTVPIERKLTGLSGVKRIKSTSAEGASTIEIEFMPDVDIDDALQRVKDKVDLAESDLPEDAEDPIIAEVNLGELPIVYVSLTGDVGLPVLSVYAEQLEDQLEAIRGVLDVVIVGDVEREIQIEVDPERLTEYGVSLADLVTLTRVENVNTPGGALELGEAKYLMRVPGEFKSAEEIDGLVVKVGEGGIVYMRDIATIKDGFKEIGSISRLNGEQSVTLTISKRSGENVIYVADAVKYVVELARGRLMPGMEATITMDQSVEIRSMVAELESSILTGLILVLIVIFIFLGFANAIFVALAIPISMLITFTVLYVYDVTLNMVVLFSLIISLGMLVDNGIVVVENIYRHLQQGMSRLEAAKLGASEVAWPITASTVTTVAAFSPMFFWPGIWGSFMVYLPMTVTIALVASLFVGLVVNPALASVFMSTRKVKPVDKNDPSGGHSGRHPFLRAYGAFLGLALNWRAVVIVVAITVLVTITSVFVQTAEIQFVPTTEPLIAFIDVDCPGGTNLETTDAIIREIESIVEPHAKNLEFVVSNVGSRGLSLFGPSDAGATPHLGRVTLDFPKLEDCEVLPSEIIRQLRGSFDHIIGAEIRIEEMEMGPPSGPPVNVEISGDDFETLAELAQQVQEVIKDTRGLVDLRDDYDKGKPEVRIIVDREKALLAGLNTQFVGLVVKTAIKGQLAGEYREGDEEYDVTVRFPKAFREDLANLETLSLVNFGGQPIPFSSVARIEQGAGYGAITRINRKRTVSVMGDVISAGPQKREGPEVLKDVAKKLAGFPLPAGYNIAFTGQNEDQQETQAFLLKAFIIALFLIALVLVTQFNSIIQPMIIMTSVVLSLGGVFFGLFLCNMPFGILMTGIGCISLAGVVVNNGIVLIDFINQLRRQGMETREAIIEAGMTRFRPVLLTAVTTVLGLVPMAVGISYDFRKQVWIIGGESAQWWGPMAIAIIFGLSFATILTLVVVPTLYSLGDSWHRLVFGDNGKPEAPAPDEA